MKDESRQTAISSVPRSPGAIPFLLHPSSFILSKWRVLLVLLVAVLAAVLLGPHAWAWYHLGAARSDLAHYHPEAAREHLKRCLTVWPSSATAHLLASRAAWQSEDLKEADQHLRACQQTLGGSDE